MLYFIEIKFRFKFQVPTILVIVYSVEFQKLDDKLIIRFNNIPFCIDWNSHINIILFFFFLLKTLTF